MANFPELRPGQRSAEAERVAVLRDASPVRLAALAAFAAAIFMAIVQLGGRSRAEGRADLPDKSPRRLRG